MLGPYTLVFVALCGVIFFARAAAFEHKSPLVWGGLSLAMSGIVVTLGGGWLSMLAAQVVLLLGIAVFRTVTEKD
jgi:hypothetical protein